MYRGRVLVDFLEWEVSVPVLVPVQVLMPVRVQVPIPLQAKAHPPTPALEEQTLSEFHSVKIREIPEIPGVLEAVDRHSVAAFATQELPCVLLRLQPYFPRSEC